jgi:hypothetical protein
MKVGRIEEDRVRRKGGEEREGKDQLGVHFMDMNIIVGESVLPTWCSGRGPEVTRHQLLSPRGQMDNGINRYEYMFY